MSELKTSKYLITDVKPDKLFPGEQSGSGKKPTSGRVTPTHVMWLDNVKHVMTRSFLAYVPAGMSHCPLIVRKVERPIFHFTVGLGADYVRE